MPAIMDIWSGDILLPGGNTIKDVGLASPNVASCPNLSPTALRFLATVETAKIPLYLAAGPSFDVWTTCEATEAWFESLLLSKPVLSTEAASNATEHEWWTLARSQSPIGILVQIQDELDDTHRPRVTEILFYGTIAPAPTLGLPTPPSSSPEHDDAEAGRLPRLRVHALPLSSDLLYQQVVTNIQPLSPSSNVPFTAHNEAQFLPPQHDAQPVPDSPKRKRDLFAEATIANKKARGRGGVGIAAAAARGSESQPPQGDRKSLSNDTKSQQIQDTRPSSAHSAISRQGSRQLSRSPSVSSDTRPLSRKGLQDGHNKRSHLSQVATVPVQAEEPTTESRNKEALSRVVMAAMRMHGMQQRKKARPQRASIAPDTEDTQETSVETASEEAAKDEEYKLVYHQTHKGVAFAFRKHIAEKPLHAQPDLLRDVVEKFLTMYLTDPLAEPSTAVETTNPVATPGTKPRLALPSSTNHRASPFDMPSASRPSIARAHTDSQIFTGSPVSRRRAVEIEAPT